MHPSNKIFERLENRIALAGDVTAAVVDGTLEITGDRRDNDLEIRQNASGDWQLTGRNNTEINDERRVVIGAEEVTDIQISLRAGADTLRMLRSEVTGDLTITTAGGSDIIDFQSVSVAGDTEATFGGGRDFVKFNRFTADGNVVIRQGAENDTLFISDSDFAADVTVNGGVGNDQVNFDRLVLEGDLGISAGDGNDQLHLRRLEMAGLLIAGGAGSDTAIIDSVFGSLSASIDLGADRDRLEMTRTQFLGGIDITPEEVTPDGRDRFVPETVGDVTSIDRPTEFVPTGTSRNVTTTDTRMSAVPTQLVQRNTNLPTAPTENRFGQPVPEQQAQQLIELLGPNWFYYGTIGR